MARYSSAPEIKITHVRTPEGEIRNFDLSRPLFCKCALAAGINTRDAAATEPYRLDRSGQDLTCGQCGRVMHVLATDEEWTEITLPNLFLERVETSCSRGRLTLSRKVGPERWKSVAQYFRYISSDALDEMDEFDMPGGWYTHPVHIDAIESALGILPRNRFAVRDAQMRAEAEAAALAEAERKAQITRLDAAFQPGDGEYVAGNHQLAGEVVDHPCGGRNIYGGGAWFVLDGQHVWHVQNNGMDGDNWAANNVRTGGAGAIGLRFDITPKRLAALTECCPERMAEIERHRDALAAEAGQEA